jgi:hypothetical protein
MAGLGLLREGCWLAGWLPVFLPVVESECARAVGRGPADCDESLEAGCEMVIQVRERWSGFAAVQRGGAGARLKLVFLQ